MEVYFVEHELDFVHVSENIYILVNNDPFNRLNNTNYVNNRFIIREYADSLFCDIHFGNVDGAMVKQFYEIFNKVQSEFNKNKCLASVVENIYGKPKDE